jgi:hypothetical protein
MANIKNCKLSDADRLRRVEHMRALQRPPTPPALLKAVAVMVGQGYRLVDMQRVLTAMGYRTKSGREFSLEYVKSVALKCPDFTPAKKILPKSEGGCPMEKSQEQQEILADEEGGCPMEKSQEQQEILADEEGGCL